MLLGWIMDLMLISALTYIGKQIFRRPRMLGEGVAPAGDDLQDEDAEAENVGFRREDAVQGVLGGHVPAAFSEGTACQEEQRWSVFRLVPGAARAY